MTTFFAGLAVVVISWLASAWMFMLLVGVVHAEWLPQLPTIGYGLALLLGALTSAAIAVRALLGSLGTAIWGDAS